MTHPMIEHVGRAVADADMEDYMEFYNLHDARASAAIRAALEYARIHISDAMLEASRNTGVPDVYLPTDDADKFRAMITAILKEIEG